MSLAIDTAKVSGVLLVDGWHAVIPESFDLDAYEYVYPRENKDDILVHGGGQSGVCACGFMFREEGVDGILSGPLTAIIAVRYQPTSRG